MTKDEKIRKARNAYYRAYRKKNKKKIAEINNRYWERRAERENGGEIDAENKAGGEIQSIETASD